MHRRAWLALALTLAACGGKDDEVDLQGSGVVVHEARTVEAFHRVRLLGAGRLVLSPDATRRVEVETDDNVQRHVRARVVDGTLELGLDPGTYTHVTLVVRVGAPAVDEVQLAGAGTVEGQVSDAKHLAVRVLGAGAVSLTGSAEDLDVEVVGAGAFHGFDLVSSTCTAKIVGAGRAEVTATSALDASVSGLGSIRYDGAPETVKTSVSGLGSIRPR